MLTMVQPESPSFFSDREQVSSLAQSFEKVKDVMSRWGIGKIDDRQTVHFCGLIQHPDLGTLVFLPREAKTNVPHQDMKIGSMTMRALARFATENSEREFESDGETGNLNALSVIARLADDFAANGLFSERVRYKTRNSGKPDWVRTIKHELAVHSNGDQGFYSEVSTTRTNRSSEILLAQIQAAVIREIYSAHGWWLQQAGSRRHELFSCGRPPIPRRHWSKALDSMLTTLYSRRSIYVAKYLRHYLMETRASSDGSFVFGVEDFHAVWEAMLRETIIRSPHDRRRQWNSMLPKPVYLRTNEQPSERRARGMQADIILENESSYTIVDAKYYAAKNADTAPGWPDIAKQIFYEKAIREVVDTNTELPVSITNIFVFPGKLNHGPLSEVVIQHTDGRAVSSAFPPVSCAYVAISDALFYYVRRSQGISLV